MIQHLKGWEASMEKKINIPQKGAARKWSQRLKELGQQRPPKELMEILNQTEKPTKVASPKHSIKDVDA
jgi:hypothetical protein